MTTTNLGMPEWWTRLADAAEAKEQNILLGAMGYFWWLVLGGVGQILFGGMYFGSKQAAQFNWSTPTLQLLYIFIGLLMIEVALGILTLRWWVYWGGLLLTLLLAGVASYELYRWINGTPITVEVGVFTILDLLFVVYAAFFLLQPAMIHIFREAAATRTRRSQFSPDLLVCTVVLALAALSGALVVNYVDHSLSDPVLGLVYVGGGAAMIFMAYGALKLQMWTWVIAWGWVALVIGLSTDAIVRRVSDNASVEGLIGGILSILFAASAVFYLLREDVRHAFIHRRPRNPLFNPLFLIAGLALAVFAVVAYLLPGALGNLAIAYTVVGLVMGAVVGLIPNADPISKLMGFLLGLLLADASYLVRGGLLPYTKLSSAIVVLLMLLVITGITALFRSTAWFVTMLLGAGTLYGLVEPEFQLTPSAYLATSSVALVSILFSFGLGYMVSVVLGLTLTVTASPSAANTDSGSDPSAPSGFSSSAPAATAGEPRTAQLRSPLTSPGSQPRTPDEPN